MTVQEFHSKMNRIAEEYARNGLEFRTALQVLAVMLCVVTILMAEISIIYDVPFFMTGCPFLVWQLFQLNKCAEDAVQRGLRNRQTTLDERDEYIRRFKQLSD